jgi:murein DD-endopeptidase MepM/ murein hydrolase activator NlpD
VRENIRYGRPDATDDEVVEAAKLASAHSFIMRLENGYDTQLDGDGANLSQGQRQLLNIARAALSKAPILVLDEATSSVDTRTERHIERGMDRLMKNRTTFVIAHRLSTVRNSNAIMVLEQGEIIERGDHDDLLAPNALYENACAVRKDPEVEFLYSDEDKIGIGDKILVSMAKPMLTVEEVRIESYTEAVPFEVREIGNSSMYVIDSRLIQKGVEGAADVTARVVYHNGVEARREILTYTVIEEPTPQIKEVGTKSLPAWWPTGTFIHPCPGYVYISSNFGYRKSFGDNHTGIDLAANSGTPIYAADGGTVKVASRNGNYGLVVYIDHGNGYVTRYAHCSKLLVKVGQKVAQGEKIALVGSTGKSTGPHLHFEIRYNGTAKNPKNYLDF